MSAEPAEMIPAGVDDSHAGARPVVWSGFRMSPHLTMVAAGALTLLMVIAAGMTIFHLHERVEGETKAHLAQLALVISEQTSRSFQAVDLVLKAAIEHMATGRSDRRQAETAIASIAVHDLIASSMASLEQVDDIVVIDANGDIVNHARSWPVARISLADRDRFRFFLNHDSSELFVSEPVRSRIDGARVLQLARRLNDSDGKFLGVLSASIRLDYFETFYSAVALGEGGSISLLRQDGMMLATYPFVDSMIGQVYSSAKSGVEEFRGGRSNNAVGYVAFNGVPGFPLTVSTAMSREAALGSWRRDAFVLVVGSSGSVAGIMLLLVMLLGKVRNMRQSEALLAAQNAQLAQSRKHLLDAQRIGKVGHWSADVASYSAVWSQQLFEIAGLQPMPSVPFSMSLELIHPDDVAAYVRLRELARKDCKPFCDEYRFVRPDGEIRWVRTEAHPQYDATGKPISFFGIVQDVTERKAAESLAEESRYRLVDAIEALTKGFVLFDKDDRFVMSNSHFRELMPDWAALMTPGMTYAEILRAGHEQGLSDSRGKTVEAWLQQKMEWHFAGSRPIERQQSNGRWIQSIDHRTSDGGTVGLRTDITAFKKVQAELEQKLADVQAIRKDLEEQKRELVATSADLRSARDAAEAANLAKSDFLAIMSHEIRTPLSGMVGMVDLLRGTSLTDEQQRYTVLAKESADLLLEVINDILDFSKLEAGRLASECIDFDVRHLVEGVVSVMGEKAKKRSLQLRASVAADLPTYLKGDPIRVRQVLLNLVANAIKFTEQGAVEINATHVETADGAIELQIDVEDSGIGMTPEVQARVFDAFVQADTSISRKYGGSGLGLAICKQLCVMMGGEIGVESSPGKGSRFWFAVKSRRGHAPAVKPEPVIAPVDRPLQILVAEDSPIIATLISSLLRKHGFQPTMVVNGARALEAVSSKMYDLVLMDVQMPEMDGISATKAIRQLTGPERDVPIIALTANALVGQRETYLAAGMNDYVTKPIQPPLLFLAINRWALRHTESPALQASSEAPVGAGASVECMVQ
jgi:two-component system, sensor histidine kinase